MAHDLWFGSWWVPHVMILIQYMCWILTMVNFPHTFLFPDNDSMWLLEMISYFPLGIYIILCITTLDKRGCWWQRVYLALWHWFFVTTQYVIGRSCGSWVVVRTQKGAVLQIFPYPWLLFRVIRRYETNWLETLGTIFIAPTCGGIFKFCTVCCIELHQFSRWYDRFKYSAVRLCKHVLYLS